MVDATKGKETLAIKNRKRKTVQKITRVAPNLTNVTNKKEGANTRVRGTCRGDPVLQIQEGSRGRLEGGGGGEVGGVGAVSRCGSVIGGFTLGVCKKKGDIQHGSLRKRKNQEA